MKSTLTVVACAIAAALSLLTFALAFSVRDRAICTAINRQNASITSSLYRAQKTLPTLAYYKEHPDELGAQLREIDRSLEAFKPLPC